MGFFKTLFTGKEETEEEKQEQKVKNQFDVFKYDGIQAQRIGRMDYALECYKRALDLQDDTETRMIYANALMSMDNLEAAAEQLEKVREKTPEDLNVLLPLAELYFQMEQYEPMETLCNAALQVNDSVAATHYLMAKMYKAKGDMINAVAQCTLAISKQQEAPYAEAYYLRAQLLMEMQQFTEAEADIDVVLSLDEENDEYLMLKGECCEALQRPEEAKEYYLKVKELNPYITKAYIRLGAILMAEGKKEEAAKIVEEGLQLAPEELKNVNGEYSNVEQEMRDAYKAMDPLGFNVGI
ncbi:MAG: tetratricopeptide repeat protein [Bacteroidaceae bacterium]|nr:tetratricopeptide repeat protein [Bacteroidaceae bacterium]